VFSVLWRLISVGRLYGSVIDSEPRSNFAFSVLPRRTRLSFDCSSTWLRSTFSIFIFGSFCHHIFAFGVCSSAMLFPCHVLSYPLPSYLGSTMSCSCMIYTVPTLGNIPCLLLMPVRRQSLSFVFCRFACICTLFSFPPRVSDKSSHRETDHEGSIVTSRMENRSRQFVWILDRRIHDKRQIRAEWFSMVTIIRRGVLKRKTKNSV